jgi:hypothetical protein
MYIHTHIHTYILTHSVRDDASLCCVSYVKLSNKTTHENNFYWTFTFFVHFINTCCNRRPRAFYLLRARLPVICLKHVPFNFKFHGSLDCFSDVSSFPRKRDYPVLSLTLIFLLAPLQYVHSMLFHFVMVILPYLDILCLINLHVCTVHQWQTLCYPANAQYIICRYN